MLYQVVHIVAQLLINCFLLSVTMVPNNPKDDPAENWFKSFIGYEAGGFKTIRSAIFGSIRVLTLANCIDIVFLVLLYRALMRLATTVQRRKSYKRYR